MTQLYELASNFKIIEDLINNAENGTEEEKELLQKALDEIGLDIKEKAENITKFIFNLKADCEALENEEKRLKEKRLSKEKRIENLKAYIKNNMEFLNLQKIETSIANISIRKNPAKLEIINEALIPNIYFKVIRELDNSAIKEALKNGSKIEGAELVTTNTSLMIK